MATQSDQERFEEAAATRDRLATLSRALRRVRTIEWLRAAGRLRVETPAGVREFDGGHLCIASTPTLAGLESEPGRAVSTPLPLGQPPARDEIDELLAVARWLDKEFDAGRVRLLEASGCAASACSGPLPAYAPVSRGGMRRGR